MSEPEKREASRSEAGAKKRADSRAFQKAAVDLLIRFHIITKNARIYEPNNAMFQNQVKAFFESLTKFLDDDGEASFRVRQSALYLNGTRLKFILGTYPIFKFILEEFRDREIGALTFLPGLSLEELVRFISSFGKKDKNDPSPFTTLLKGLEDEGIDHIQVERVSDTETFSSLHKDTARIFFLSILHLKECFERDRRSESIKVNTTRRLMQSIFNHIVDNESFVFGLTNLKNFDEYTLNHSVNVCMLAIALGRRLGLSRGELVDLGVASFLHDLGKLETPIEILNKPSKLNAEEWKIMELHPQQGAEKLLHLKDFKRLPLRAVHVALEHHIKEDLSGYPHYFKRDDVNLFSKIVKVVDYFDAVTTKRVYRATSLTRTEALSLMLEKSGTEFNQVILKAFVNLMGVFPVGTLVALTNGELAIVFEINPDPKLVLRPKVKLITDAEGARIDGDIVDLSERDAETDKFPRTIAKALNPDTYGVEVADYFLAQAQ